MGPELNNVHVPVGVSGTDTGTRRPVLLTTCTCSIGSVLLVCNPVIARMGHIQWVLLLLGICGADVPGTRITSEAQFKTVVQDDERVVMVYFGSSRSALCAEFERELGAAVLGKLKSAKLAHVNVDESKGIAKAVGDDASRVPSLALFKVQGGDPHFLLTGADVPSTPKLLRKRIKRALSGLAKGGDGKFLKASPKQAEATTATASHILVKTESEASALRARLLASESESKSKSKSGASGSRSASGQVDMALFAKLAAEHSNCPSGKKGGSLGEFGRGQMVPEFEQPSFYGELNTLLGPVKTKFGYHLLVVTERK